MSRGIFTRKRLRRYHARYVEDVQQIRNILNRSWKSSQEEYRRIRKKLNWKSRSRVSRREILEQVEKVIESDLLSVWPPVPELIEGQKWTENLIKYSDATGRLYNIYAGVHVTKMAENDSDKDPEWEVGDSIWMWFLLHKYAEKSTVAFITRESVLDRFNAAYEGKIIENVSDVYCIALRPSAKDLK